MQPKVIKIINDALLESVVEKFGLALETAHVYISEEHGQVSTRLALPLAARLKVDKKLICNVLKCSLEKIDFVREVICTETGYVNFSIDSKMWQLELLEWLSSSLEDTLEDLGKGGRVNLEYVSVNPTGPLHIGHARVAVYGDVLANLLSKFGYTVTREFYINDRGVQIDTLAQSLLIRYSNIALKQNHPIPKGLYPGSYLIELAQKLYEVHGSALLNDADCLAKLKQFAVDAMMDLIRQDLELLGVKHDNFVSETRIHELNKVQEVVEHLRSLGLIYEGILPAPKGEEGEDYSPDQQLLFKSTEFGDVQDRSVQRPDGTWTYFGSELAYVKDKLDREFDSIIVVLGADHVGYIERLHAAVKAQSKVPLEVHLCNLVRYLQGGSSISMSKRSGEFARLSSLIEDVGRDAVRFMMVSRRNDSQLDFDLQRVKEQSKDNPVFYVQYAYARAQSLLRKAQLEQPDALDSIAHSKFHLERLVEEEELALVRKIIIAKATFADAARTRAPHKVAFFIQELATRFHSLWDLKKPGCNYRFILKEDAELTAARLALVKGFTKALKLGLDLIGVNAPDYM